MPTSKKQVSVLGEKPTSSNIYELARFVSPAAFYAIDYPLKSIPLVVTFWAANGDKAELQKLGFDFDQIIWRSFDVQPMAKCLRPYGKVASKGHNGQYRLIEASEEFGLCMTSQKMLLDQYADGEARTERYPVQHCAVEDAVNAVKLTGLLMEDLASIDCVSSICDGFPPRTVWPSDGLNTRILSIDT
jgi:hypothetical protein